LQLACPVGGRAEPGKLAWLRLDRRLISRPSAHQVIGKGRPEERSQYFFLAAIREPAGF